MADIKEPKLMKQAYYLPAKKLRLRQGEDDSLIMHLDGQSIALSHPKRALPLSNPDHFIVLYDEAGNEMGIVRDMSELEPGSCEALQNALKQVYHIEQITRILEVERDALSGQVQWRVEIATDPIPFSEQAAQLDKKALEIEPDGHAEVKADGKQLTKVRWFHNSDKAAPNGEENAVTTEERVFLIGGQEDVQTARYPHIYIVDIDRNRYEILDCEALDIESRQAAERYF